MKLVLLDRDGVLNHDRPDCVKSIAEMIVYPEATTALALLTRSGFTTVLVTNQSAVGRGFITEAELAALHAHLRAEIEKGGGRIDDIFFCPDHPGRPTEFRKPAPGMLLAALKKYGANAADTYMVGDSLRDMEAASRAGCRRILVKTGNGADTLDHGLPPHLQPITVCEDILDAAEVVTRNN